MRKRHKNRLHHLPNAIPPDEHALYKDNIATYIATGNGELSKVIADIARRVSCFMNT